MSGRPLGVLEILGGVAVGRVVWDEKLPPKNDCKLLAGETHLALLSGSPFPSVCPSGSIGVQKLGGGDGRGLPTAWWGDT